MRECGRMAPISEAGKQIVRGRFECPVRLLIRIYKSEYSLYIIKEKSVEMNGSNLIKSFNKCMCCLNAFNKANYSNVHID